jgi:hypothetical protein
MWLHNNNAHFASLGPYTNVLDLALFPAMSKRNSEVLQLYNNTEATKERTWEVRGEASVKCQVGGRTGSTEVARAFILAFRVMKKIIDHGGKW